MFSSLAKASWYVVAALFQKIPNTARKEFLLLNTTNRNYLILSITGKPLSYNFYTKALSNENGYSIQKGLTYNKYFMMISKVTFI